jgi:eukaryotic-like serine/threonine-protein kinase
MTSRFMSSRPEAERALIRAGGSSSDDDAERFYALRVSDYARVLTLMFGGIYAVGVVLTLFVFPGRFISVHVHPAKLANLGFGLTSLAIWILARRPSAPRWLVTMSDGFLPVSVMVVVCVVTMTVPPWHGLYLAPLLIAAILLVLRAALLPSPPGRTALVGVLTSIPVAIASHSLAAMDPTLPEPVTANIVLIACSTWCVALVAATVMVSRAIYGLHHEIRSVRRLGQYVLGDLIGEGGMGSVYRAEHAMLRRPTAVKMLLPDRAGRESIARFEREVKLTARLTHPNTVAIYDYGRTRDGLFYYAMEYLDGLSLEELVRRFGPQSPGRVIHILMQAAGALAEAHALGLIHRDIKPANVLFCERGGTPDTVKLVDFGLVKSLEPEDGPALTHTNAIKGTPQYLAPESIITPSSVDHRVDLYGLGGVAYYLLTGRPPFEGESVLEICGHHLHTPPTPPSNVTRSTVPPDLDALVLKLLAKKPEDRPSGAQALYDELALCARKSPWRVDEARTFWLEFHKGPGPSRERASAGASAIPSS